jgi:2-keto-4-pentenoate hydratase
MHTQASRFAHQLMNARADARLIPPLTSSVALTLEEGYEVGKCILDHRIAQGEVMVGRKIGFTNRAIWGKYGDHDPIVAPIWAPMFASTVRYADDNHGLQSLASSMQPRLEPEIVFSLRRAPSPDADLQEMADCIDWMAHGIEIVDCPFPDWKFDAPDVIAAFGLHGTLIIGERRSLVAATRRNLARLLAESSVSLSLSGSFAKDDSTVLCDAGFGSDVLDSPVHALLHLHKVLQSQPQFKPLAEGEIITTGTWTDAHAITPGETWTTAFSGIGLPGLTLSFV